MTAQPKEHNPTFLERVDELFNKYKNYVFGVITVIVLGVGYLFYQKYQTAKLDEEAKTLITQAQGYFSIDSLNLALYGDGSNLGFIDLADEYGHTRTGNLAKYYAGVCYLKLGEFENAIDYLEDFSTSSETVQANAWKCLADAYAELGNTDEAKHYYTKAANHLNNETLTPYYLLIAGDYCRYIGDSGDAIEFYERIEKEYPKSREAQNIKTLIQLAKTQG